MADPLHGIENDVTFDFGAAEELATRADLAATGVDGTVGGRNFWTTHAMAEFRGHFSELFEANSTTANTDAGELADALRLVAEAARRLKEEAEKENERRRIAREWKAEQDARSDFHEGWDDFWGSGEDPPVGPPADPQILDVPAGPNGVRQTPAPGAGGGSGGGTSSVRPSDLRGFVTWVGNVNLTRRNDLATTRSAYHDFVAGCGWGTLEAEGVLTGFSVWLDANDNDEQWARTVADAFEAAGSEGDVVTLSNSALSAALQSAGVDASRQDLTIPAPAAVGNPGTSGYADDPVNTATGNFVENEVDLAFPGGCSALALTRTYNSLTDTAGAFGPGWSSWTESRVRFDDATAVLVLHDGREIHFPRLGGGWDRATGESLWLTRTDDELVVSGNDGTRWELTGEGTLLAVRRPAGDRVLLDHDGGRLVRLRHDRGRHVDLVWEGERVVEARASDGRVVSYTYDEHGRLAAATGALGTRTYGWDEAGLVDSVTNEAGVVEVQNTYDDRGRVARQRSPFGRTSRFAYLPGRVTVVSDEDGTRSNTWIADRRGRLVGVVDAHEQRQSMSYDPWGNRVLTTERDGAVTVSEHDDRGRLVRRVLPGGGDLRWTYDSDDRLVEVVTEEGATTRLSYEGDDRSPALVVDPEGGHTRMTWRHGLMRRLVDPTGVELRFEHDAHGDLLSVTAADGGCARFERDEAGRLVAAVDPLGHRTAYAYDPRGLLLERRDPDGSVWLFEHDDAGRRTAVVDPTGARTAVEHGPHGEVSQEVDALGRARSLSYDDLGNLAAVELPDGATWRFSHDALSRLVETTDPTGATWTRAYDAVGSVVREEDPTGTALTATVDRAANLFSARDAGASLTLELDPLGRPTSMRQTDGSVASVTYDRCGRVRSSTDASGAVTTIERDAAGRPTVVTGPTGATSRWEHDRTGRLVAVVDARGGRTTLERDLTGRVVRTVMPDGTSVEQDHDALGRVVRRRVAGHGTTRIEYDPAGRVRAVHEPRFGRRSFVRDAAGRVVEAVDANGGRTRYEYDEADRVVAVVDPLGARTERAYDAAGRMVAQTDALGRTGTTAYDAAGRRVEDHFATGQRLGWTYDAGGRLVSFSTNGATAHSVERDLSARRERVVEQLGNGRRSVLETCWDSLGRLTTRSRDGRTVRWERDANGDVAALVDPEGRRTTYERDASGLVVAVEHPLLGRAEIERDAAGRVRRARAGDAVHTWERGPGGQVLVHTVVVGSSTSRTEVARDETGRVTAVVRDDGVTTFEHDAAGQLLTAASDAGSTTRWRYDAAGRLVTEALSDGTSTTHEYDAAGQLRSSRGDHGVTTYAYDAAGRRTTRRDADGATTEYVWDDRGWLDRVRRHAADGTTTRETTLRVDALGELAEIDGLPVLWDTASPASAPMQVGELAVVSAGPLTGIAGDGSRWVSSGWREARSGTDPWQPEVAVALPNGTTIGAGGELLVAGLEWMGARAYDPLTRGFLSVDPVVPEPASAWSGNPYAYAGNDPVHATDPLGLSPLTDAELVEWTANNQGVMGEYGGYIVGGIAVVAGVAMIATGVGGPAGVALIAAGTDAIIQQATTGQVNWGQVVVSGVVGLATGGLGAVTSSAVRQGTMSGARALAWNVGGNAMIGGTGNAAGYYVQGGRDAREAAGSFAGGFVSGAASGVTPGLSVPGAHAAPSLSSTVIREGERIAVDGIGGFAGQVTQDVVAGNDVNWGDAAAKGAGYSVSGFAGRHAADALPERIGVGQHRPGGPVPAWRGDFGAEGLDSVGTAATDRLAEAY